MAKYLYLLILLFSFNIVKGNPKYEEIDRQSKNVPDSLKTSEEIAKYLTLKLKSEHEKVRALHIWITHNIKYDLSLLNSDVTYTSYDKLVEDTINFGKGICDNYSQLFHYMCNSIGIESYVISGYTPEIDNNEIPDISHSWNAVKIEGDYLFLDNTWAAGYVNYKGNYIHKFIDEYFLISSKEFIKTHVPFDPIWQFLNNPISNLEIENKDFTNLHNSGNFNYKDSISTMKTLDSITLIKKKIKRITQSGITNKLIQKYVNESKEQIENLTYNEWISTFNDTNKSVNKAKDEINMGINFDNTFIGYKNKRFRNPKIADTQIENTIKNANVHFYQGKNELKKSRKILYRLEYSGKNKEKLKLTEKHKQELIDFINELEYKILEVEPSIIKDTDYSKRYLKKWKPLRDFVPYE